jgi:cytoskeletal protein RodZ
LGEIIEAVEVRNLMKQTFSEAQLKQYQEYLVMLENLLSKDKPKESEKKLEDNRQPSNVQTHFQEPEVEEIQIAKKIKPGKVFSMLLGGAITAISGISLFWLFKNKNKFAC